MALNLLRGLLLIAAISSNLCAQNLRDPQFMTRAEEGFNDIFNMDYDHAESVFASLAHDYPQHPAPPLYLASIQWLREMLRRQDLDLNRFLAPSYFSAKTNQVMPAEERKKFIDNLHRAEFLCNAILKKRREDKDARYFLATAHGLRSSFAITIEHKLREAFSQGNKAYAQSRQLAAEDPAYHDAYLTMGIYEYVVGSIPWYMRWMVYLVGGHGSKQQGLTHLKLAAEKGQYVRDQARLVMMVLNVREQRYPEALELARTLNAQYPRSYLFAINLAQILRLAGRKDEAAAMFLQVEKQVESGAPNFDKLQRQSFRFSLAMELLYMGKLDLARERFDKAVEDPSTPPRENALSQLQLCRILSWKGERDKAVDRCRTVLSLVETDGSHNQARKLLKTLGTEHQ